MLIFFHIFLDKGIEGLKRLTHESVRRGAAMFGVRIRPPAGYQFVRFDLSSSGHGALPERHRTHLSGLNWRRGRIFILLSFFLSVALIAQAAKTTPTITWATPAEIHYGTALSATQLDATASVAGTFVYTPAAGGVLPPGAHSLSVTFTLPTPPTIRLQQLPSRCRLARPHPPLHGQRRPQLPMARR